MRYLSVVLIMTCISMSIEAAVYVSSPNGRDSGNGSKDNPWPSLQQCVASGKINKLKGGDTLYLTAGFHGDVQLRGRHDAMVTIAAAPQHDVRLSKLTLSAAHNWHIKDLRVSPSFGSPYKGNIVSFNDRSTDSGQVIIEGLEVFAVDDHKGLDVKAWMGLNSGILMGRHGKGSIVRNCYIRNTRFALVLSAYDGRAEGNIIENFSADGIRMVRDGQTSEYNVIKAAFAGDSEGDKNHDDAIQCFLHNKGTGTLRNQTVNHNIIMGSAPGVEPHSAVNQGIGFFDGPLVNFHVEGNVVMVSHWHGVSLFDAQGCTITKNVTYTIHSGRLKPWVMLGTKLKQAKDNTVTDNYAMSFKLKQPGTIENNNKVVTKAIYEQALKELSAKHFELYGEFHRVAKRHRITGKQVDVLPDEKKDNEDKQVLADKGAVQAKLTRPAITVSDEAFQEMLGQLQTSLNDYCKNNKRDARYYSSVFKQEVSIKGPKGSSYLVHVPKMGSSMTINIFKKMKRADALALCQAIADKHNDSDNALLSFFYYANDDTANGSFHLRKAGAAKDEVESRLTNISAK